MPAPLVLEKRCPQRRSEKAGGWLQDPRRRRARRGSCPGQRRAGQRAPRGRTTSFLLQDPFIDVGGPRWTDPSPFMAVGGPQVDRFLPFYSCGWTQVDRLRPVYGCGWTPDGQDPPRLRLWVGGPEVDIKQSLSSQLSCRVWSLPDLTCDPAEGFHHPGYSRLVNAHSMTPGDPWNPPPPLHPSS